MGSPTYDLAKFVAEIISPLAGQTLTFVKNSAHFTGLINQQQLNPGETMVNFNVSSLFTNVPLYEALDIIQHKLEQDSLLPDWNTLTVLSILKLLWLCLQTTYFTYDNEFYQKKQGAAMGSPLSNSI